MICSKISSSILTRECEDEISGGGKSGLLRFVLAQLKLLWRDLLEQVPVGLESECRQ